MPVLETQACGREDGRAPFFFAGHPSSLLESTATSHLINTIDPPANDGNSAPPVTGRSVADGAQGLWIRGFDVTVAGIAVIILLPLMLLIALLVKMTSPGPALFRQQRVGRDGVLFPCLKFRSMVIDAQAQLDRLLAQSEDARLEWERDQKLRDDPRITPIGDFLRKTSLDELPQLFNILVGQMSIVGPRPIVEGEIVRYGSRFTDYCSVRPGLTGLWQISGRNDVSYAMRVRLDSRYAHRQSLALNVAICVKTVPAILTSRGCY
jgi:exopolysaccharide production protein ExoY